LCLEVTEIKGGQGRVTAALFALLGDYNYNLYRHYQLKYYKIMKGFSSNIEKDTLENGYFRKVLYTGKNSQLVLMSLKPNEEIGMEVHPDNDQFFRFEKGQGKCIIDGNEYELADGVAIVVPAGAKHNIINTSDTEYLKLYTIYSPAHHKDGIVRTTKEEAEANEEDFDGKTSE